MYFNSFYKFTEKHLCQSPFFIVIIGYVELVEASKGNRLKCDNHILELFKKADKEPKILNCIKTFVHKNCMKSVMNIYFDFKFLLIA